MDISGLDIDRQWNRERERERTLATIAIGVHSAYKDKGCIPFAISRFCGTVLAHFVYTCWVTISGVV